jgi:hypothetical protein
MNVAIIGAGNVGGALARGLTRAGHSVVVTATDPEHARALADEVGGSAAGGVAEAADAADAVVLAVPYQAASDVARELGAAAAGKVVIDATNPIGADFTHAVGARSGAEEIAASLPDAHVVKAFNTVFAANQGDPVLDGVELDGFYAGDDEQAKQPVRDLLASMGYRPIDAGPLAAALSLEHLALLNISLNARHGWAWRDGWKLIGPTG